MTVKRQRSRLLGISLGILLIASSGQTQEQANVDLEADSLALRTALHHDPTLQTPLNRLLKQYRSADRLDDLVEIYRSHVHDWPQDESAHIVLVRLLLATGSEQAEQTLRDAVAAHPKSAYLHFLLFESRYRERPEEALKHLDRAIRNETYPARQRAWIERLLQEGRELARLDLAEPHLDRYCDLFGGSAEGLLGAAQRLDEYGFPKRALAELERAADGEPDPELGVEIELLAASLETRLDRRSAAASRLDKLLGRLTEDYWRRGEVLQRRARLVETAAEREAMINGARERYAAHPEDERTSLDLARLLVSLDRPNDALKLLLEAGKKLTQSSALEKLTLTVLDRVGDASARAAYLQSRLGRGEAAEGKSAANAIERHDLRQDLIQTLYVLGRDKEALADLDAWLEELDASMRWQRLLEMARFLRERFFIQDAIPLYERVVKAEPGRVDVLRELCEVHFSVGERSRVQELLDNALPEEIEITRLIDLLQFLLAEKMYVVASRILDQQTIRAPDHLGLRLFQARVKSRIGYSRSANRILMDCRALADTAPRYHKWLSVALEIQEKKESTEEFIEAEQARVLEESNTPDERDVERVLAFAEAVSEQSKLDLLPLFDHLLTLGLEVDLERRVRRRYAAHLLGDRQHGARAGEQLSILLETDPEYANEHRARRAILYQKQQRGDLALGELPSINVSQIRDVELLEDLKKLCTDLNAAATRLAVLEALTLHDPDTLQHWEDWLTTLVAASEEVRFRVTVRRLVALGDKLDLSSTTRVALRKMLSESYWRSIGRLCHRRDQAALIDALELIDRTLRATDSPSDQLWCIWARCYCLHYLERPDARADAFAELQRRMDNEDARLERIAAASEPAGDVAKDSEESEESAAEALLPGPRIDFPDGLSTSRAGALAILQSPPSRTKASVPPVQDRKGPLPPFAVRWAFETPTGTHIAHVQAVDRELVLVTDVRGTMHAISGTSGKFLWSYELQTALPVGPVGAASLQIPEHDETQIYTTSRGKVVALGRDGQVRWESTVGLRHDYPRIVLAGERIVAHAAKSGDLVGIDRTSGRIAWQVILPASSHAWPHAVVIATGDRVFVSGERSLIVSASTGAVEWLFDSERSTGFPARLKRGESAQKSTTGSRPGAASSPLSSAQLAWQQRYFRSGRLPPPGGGWMSPYVGSYINLPTPASIQAAARSRADIRYAAPALAWQAPLAPGEGRAAHLLDQHLILLRGSPGRGVATNIDLILPIFGDQKPVKGTLLGAINGHLILAEPGKVQLVDGRSWHSRQFSTAWLDLDGVHTPPELAVDGAVLHLVGARGVMAVHASSLETIYQVPWKDISAGARVEPERNLRRRVHYAVHGVTEYAHSPGIVSRSPAWNPSMNPAQQGAYFRLPLATVSGDLLISRVRPWQVIALGSATTQERESR